MVTLGLDASTTCVGYAFTKDKKILDMGFIDIKKETTPKEKVQKVLEFLHTSKHMDEVMDINIDNIVNIRTFIEKVKHFKYFFFWCGLFFDVDESHIENLLIFCECISDTSR